MNFFSSEDFSYFLQWEIDELSASILQNKEKFNVFGVAYIMVCKQPTHMWPSAQHHSSNTKHI